MAKSTWRFEFVDINKSITVNEADNEWVGYAVVRAPKGQTKAMFVPAGNTDMLQAMFGYASADWPDLYEVLDFNHEYGVYVSAPTVDVAEYPNYYGGVYFTKQGVQNLYKVTDKKNPNYEVGILVGKETTTLAGVESSSISLDRLNLPVTITGMDSDYDQACFKITGVDPAVFKRLKYIDLNWKKKGQFRYKLDKTNGYLLPDASCVTDPEAQKIVCGTFELDATTGKYRFVVGGLPKDQCQKASRVNEMNSPRDEENYGIPFLDFAGRSYKAAIQYDYTEYMLSDDDQPVKLNSISDWQNTESYANFYKKITEGGTVTTYNGKKLVYDRPITKMFRLVYDIEDDVYAYMVQPSPSAVTTQIKIDNPVYDKYQYNKAFYYTTASDGPDPATNAEAFAKTLTDDGNIILSVETKNANTTLKVLQFQYAGEEDEDDINGDDESEATTTSNASLGKWVDVTDDFETSMILAFDTVDAAKNADVHHKIFRVLEGSLTLMTANNPEEDLVLQENKMYNSFHAIALEEDQDGEIHTSGDFTGSLDEFGTDENGGDIYWEDLLPPDESVCFAEIYIVKTFDGDLDENGIYTGTRITEETVSVTGQRYVDFVVEENIKAGLTGGNVTDTSIKQQKRFTKILKEGLIEAAKPKYGDCSLFMEFSGLDTLKSYFPAIRTMHNTSTIISPKNIDEQLFANVNKIKVAGRLRGTAQYCQELLYKDKNIRKKYYACPIGAIGVMLMRIMEDYLGGVAPAWLNEGSVGGQLEDCMQRAPINARWDFEDLDTKVMDQKGLNPILMDTEDGVMIVSHRTTEQNVGDWSYLGHSMSFDLCKREIRDNVMKPQLEKRISPYYISKRQMQVNSILAKRTGGDSPIWAYAHSDIASANNEYTKAQMIFCIPVEVKVFPFSEKVRLSFTNLAQTTTMSD